MADEQDQAEALDDDKLGGDYPPENPLGVDDPTRDDRIRDSFEDRGLREDPDGERVRNLTLTDLDQGAGPDEEKDLVGDQVGGEDDPLANDRTPVAPEESAVHTESQ
jgi:hypothetical protein